MARILSCFLAWLSIMIGPAHAGMDIDADRAMRELLSIDQQLERLRNNPLRDRFKQLQEQIEFLEYQIELTKSAVNEVGPDRLLFRLIQLNGELRAVQEQIAKLDEQQRQLLTNLEPFPSARNKVAVFMFDDPDQTGLSNDLSLIISKHMLFSTPVGSYAIVTYQSNLRSPDTSGLTYFDKVDKLTRDFGYTVAVWGEIKRRPSGGIVVEAFAQIPDKAASKRFEREVTKETIDGRSVSLVASLTPQRLQIASIEFTEIATAELKATAAAVRVLRDRPSKKGKVTLDLPEGQPYFLSRSSGDWVELKLGNGDSGWTSVRALCSGECRKLLNIADFSNALVGFADGQFNDPIDSAASSLLRPIIDQMQALSLLTDKPAASIDIMTRWVKERSANRTVPPGGSAYLNLYAIAKLASSQRPLDQEVARDAAKQLAKASVVDPTNIDILRNLSTLFDFIGDRRRQEIADELVTKYQ